MAKGKYKTHVLPKFKEIGEWYRQGATDTEVSKRLGISESSLYKYLNENSEFSELVMEAKKYSTIEVANTMYKRAVGYEYEEEKIKYMPDGSVIREVFKKHLPSDVGAGKFVLVSKDPDNWKDKQDHEIEHKGEVKHNTSELEKKLDLFSESFKGMSELDEE